jgi:hypothetical protein
VQRHDRWIDARQREEGGIMSQTWVMRRVLALVAVFTAGAALLVPATSAADSSSGTLGGTWTSIDGDGSLQTLDITGSGNRVYAMVYLDDAATGACGGDPARLSGPGFVDGDDVLMVATLVCLPGGNAFRGRLAVGFHYDGGTDTLTDDFGIIWSRAD